jgi:divalent metal cation (Fe/Co/Zn/Cd) transporter
VGSSPIVSTNQEIPGHRPYLSALPLGLAFVIGRRPANDRYTYGYGRGEDLAGLTVVLVILISALVAGYEAVNRLLHPQDVRALGWVAAAAVVGFIGSTRLSGESVLGAGAGGDRWAR